MNVIFRAAHLDHVSITCTERATCVCASPSSRILHVFWLTAFRRGHDIMRQLCDTTHVKYSCYLRSPLRGYRSVLRSTAG